MYNIVVTEFELKFRAEKKITTTTAQFSQHA